MKLQLKKVRIDDRMSETTLCFSADLYADGRLAGQVCNRGRGAQNEYHWSDEELGKQIQAWAERQPTDFDFEKLDQIIGDMLDECPA